MRNTRREFHTWVLENIYPKVCQKSSWQNVLDYTSLSVQGFWNAKCWRRKSLRQSRHCNGEVLRKSWGVNHGRMVGYWNPENYQLSTQRSPLLVPRPKKKERQVVPFWKSDITKLMWFSALRWINWSKVVHYSLALCRVTKPFFSPGFAWPFAFFRVPSVQRTILWSSFLPAVHPMAHWKTGQFFVGDGPSACDPATAVVGITWCDWKVKAKSMPCDWSAMVIWTKNCLNP